MSKQRCGINDCTNKPLHVGDRVSIDKIGEGVVSHCGINFGTRFVEVFVPGAKPEKELFDARQIKFWQVRKVGA